MSFNQTEFETKVKDYLGKKLPALVVLSKEGSCVLSFMPMTSTFGFYAFEIHWWNQKFCVKDCPDGDLTVIEGNVYDFIVDKTIEVGCF
jgi:hypothetical protein